MCGVQYSISSVQHSLVCNFKCASFALSCNNLYNNVGIGHHPCHPSKSKKTHTFDEEDDAFKDGGAGVDLGDLKGVDDDDVFDLI